MLIEFTIENFRSFKDKTTFSMQTAPYLKKFTDTNTFKLTPINILKSAAIFGPNGSGKTNIINAIELFESMIVNSYRLSKNKSHKLPFQPFKMSNEVNDNDFTLFEIVLLINDNVYKYAVRYNEEMILYEALSKLRKNNEELFYKREYDERANDYNFYLHEKTPDLRDKLRKDALYLSLLREFTNDFNGFTEGKEFFDWFVKNLMIIKADDRFSDMKSLIEELENEDTKENVLNFLRVADFNIVDLDVRKRKHEVPEKIKSILTAMQPESTQEIEDYIEMIDVYTVYNKTDENGEVIGKTNLHADSFESRGTLKMILISLILLDAIDNGKTVFIDEFDNAFHLEISIFLLKIFNSPVYNKKSQFILNTHDISLMDSTIMRVDQIWFTEKSKGNISDLYSIYDFNGTNNNSRSDVSYARDYMRGKFGSLPIVNESFFNQSIFKEGEKHGTTK